MEKVPSPDFSFLKFRIINAILIIQHRFFRIAWDKTKKKRLQKGQDRSTRGPQSPHDKKATGRST